MKRFVSQKTRLTAIPRGGVPHTRRHVRPSRCAFPNQLTAREDHRQIDSALCAPTNSYTRAGVFGTRREYLPAQERFLSPRALGERDPIFCRACGDLLRSQIVSGIFQDLEGG